MRMRSHPPPSLVGHAILARDIAEHMSCKPNHPKVVSVCMPGAYRRGPQFS